MMTELLKKASEEVQKLTDAEQDRIAAWMLNELETNPRWSKHLSRRPEEPPASEDSSAR